MDTSCNECIKGTVHAGLPIGKEEQIHGLNTYVTGNRTNPKGIVVMYSDIFGLLLPNNKLIADAIGKSGDWLVYLPDFFEGDPVPLKVADLLIPVDAASQSTLGKYTGILASAPSFVMWSMRHKTAPTDKTCMDFLRALRRSTGKEQKIGMVGFCWGGKYAIRAGLESNRIEVDGVKVPLVDTAVALHPSNLSLPTDAEGLSIPISYGWGEEDIAVSIKTKDKIEDIYAQAAKAGQKVPEAEHKVYRPGRHGFAVRGNPDDPKERACLEDSMKQILTWLGRWLL